MSDIEKVHTYVISQSLQEKNVSTRRVLTLRSWNVASVVISSLVGKGVTCVDKKIFLS